jgi:pilus assembly protein CpaE
MKSLTQVLGLKRKADDGLAVFVLTEDAKTMAAVQAAADASGGGFVVTRVNGFDRIEDLLRKAAPSVILIDIDQDRGGTFQRLERMSGEAARHRVVIVSSRVDNDTILEAMQAGARHCLAKSAIAAELEQIVLRLTRGLVEAPSTDRAVTVLSSGGGCGSTTIALNLAAEFGTEGKESPALLIDLDTGYGSVATYLGLSGAYGIADVLRHEREIDPQLVQSTATKCSDGLHVLLSPASIDFSTPAPLDYGNLASVVDAARKGYEFTVIDAPRIPMSAAAILANASSLTLIVLELSVIDVRTARSIANALGRAGVPSERLLLVVNRYRKRSKMLSLADAERALEGLPLVTVSNDFESAMQSLNLGQPLSRAAPRSRIRRDIKGIADAIKNGSRI